MWVISFFEISASLFEWVSPSNKYHTLKLQPLLEEIHCMYELYQTDELEQFSS